VTFRQVGETAAARLQLLVFVGEETRCFDLPAEGAVVVGRGEGCQVRIEHASVSRRHARLQLGPKLVLEDLQSANGTVVVDRTRPRARDETEGVKLLSGGSVDVELGDPIVFGSVTAFLRREVPSRLELAELGSEATAAGPVVDDGAMREVYEQALSAARSDISVLILGETGVGKELLARAIHERSPRAGGPFLAINCGALGEALVESELFGHEKGAFTGAGNARAGLIESANGGTLLLDEAGELPLAIQTKLLRVLEDRQVLPIGARSPRPIDVRFIAATNRDLDGDVQAGRFRRDLFFRLNALSLAIPPLRERRGEIAALARLFLKSACSKLERERVPTLSQAALELLERHDFPGNVRELRNVIERAVVLSRSSQIEVKDLPRALIEVTAGSLVPAAVEAPAAPDFAGGEQATRLRSELRSLERERVLEALAACGGNQTLAAKRLGVARRTLIARLEEFGLPRPRKPS
jgi:two-component system, NtrC family, response regulator AtoC